MSDMIGNAMCPGCKQHWCACVSEDDIISPAEAGRIQSAVNILRGDDSELAQLRADLARAEQERDYERTRKDAYRAALFDVAGLTCPDGDEDEDGRERQCGELSCPVCCAQAALDQFRPSADQHPTREKGE